MVKWGLIIFFCVSTYSYGWSFSISEISFDGTAERIEFYNSSGKDLTGTLVLSGAKSSLFYREIVIGSGEILLLSDKEQSVLSGCVLSDQTGFSLSDTQAFSIYWYLSGTLYSGSITIPQEQVQKVNNTGNTFSLSGVVVEESKPSPCRYRLLEPIQPSDNSIQPPDDPLQSMTTGGLLITEIYPFDKNLTEYIEITCITERCEGEYTIGGAGHGSADKNISIAMVSGQYLLLADNLEYISNIGNTYLLSSLSLTDGGEEISISRQSGQLIDSVVYSGGNSKDEAFYRDGRWFTPTPGYNEGLLSYFAQPETEEGVSCGIRIQNNKPFFSHHKTNLIATHQGKDIQNSSKTFQCTRSGPGGELLSQQCNPSYFPVFGSGVLAFSVRITQGSQPYCSVSTSLNLPELPQQQPSAPKTVSEQKQQTSQKTKSENTTLLHNAPFIIIKALPNPEGNDSGKEQLVIQNTSSKNLSLSGLYLTNGSRKKSLPSLTIEPFSPATIIGSLGLINSAGCYRIYNNQFKTEEFCYVSDDNEGRVDHISGIHSHDTGLLKSLKIIQENQEVCIATGSQKLFCKKKKYPDSAIKERKSTAAKYLSLEKKYDTLHSRYNRLKKSNTTTITALKQAREEYNTLYTLTKNTLYLFQQTIRGENQLLYEEWGLSSLFTDRKYLTNETKKGRSAFAYGGVTDRITDIEHYNQLTQGALPLHESDLAVVLQALYSTSKSLFDDYLP